MTRGTVYVEYPGRSPSFEYHHDPEKTAAGRRGDLVTAGDYGYFDEDGSLFLLDRRTDLIISGGVNIYPAEAAAFASSGCAVPVRVLLWLRHQLARRPRRCGLRSAVSSSFPARREWQ